MKCKHLLATLLCLAMLVGMIPAMAFSSASALTLTSSYEPHKYIVGDTITNTNVHRIANSLIKYDHGYDFMEADHGADNYLKTSNDTYKALYAAGGKNYTCTNQWGMEVAVNKFGFVTAKSGAGNMEIPANGYVLSGINEYANKLKEIEIGDYIRMSNNQYYVYRTTDDSKFTDASAAFKIKKTDVLEIVDGGNTPTKATEWTTTALIKATAAGTDGVANHSGYLVKLGGKETKIPSGYFGLILSGSPLSDESTPYNVPMLFSHYAAPGAVVTIGGSEIFFRYDVAAAKRAARVISGTTDSTVTLTFDFSAKTILNDAKTKFELVNTARMQTLYDNMAAIADAVQSMTTIEEMEQHMATLYQNYEEMRDLEFEKRAVETRALWWRPLENDFVSYSAAELDAHIEENVSRFKSLGYNQLFVESFYNSCTIFPVPSSVGYNGLCFSQHPYLVPTNVKCGSSGLYGKNTKLTEPYDMLQRTIDICNKYDIECHVWWQVLYIGYERHNVSNSDDLVEYGIGYTIENDILNKGSSSKYYNWLNVAHDNTYRSGSVAKKLTRFWLNPANSGARQLLKNLLTYVCANYDTYSFQLDYFRHPNDGLHEFGYDSETVAAFKAAYPTYKNTDLTASGNWKNADWVQFRANYITSLIGEMRAILDEQFPDICLTTSPQPDPASALKNDLQDVSAWLANDYIDNIYPMAYGYHLPAIVTSTLVEQNAGRFVTTGLSIGYENEDLEMEWVRQIRHAGADGVAHFGEIDHYKNTIWNEPAVTPTGNAARAARVYLTQTMKDRVAKMLELDAITSSKQTALNAAIDAADKAIRLYGIESTQALSAINALNNQNLSGNAKTAIATDVNYLLKIRTNSHDSAKEDRRLSVKDEVSSNSTLSVGDVNVANDSDTAFVYTAATKTLFVKATSRFWPTLSGAMAAPVTVVADDGVDTLEFKNVTLTAENTNLIENSGMTVELTGTNVINGSLGATKFFGTGALYNGSTLVRMQGDVSGDKKLTTTDVTQLLRHNVKAETLSDTKLLLCDANGDGAVNTIDTRMFLKAALTA